MIPTTDETLLPRFREALAGERLTMMYQPKIALSDGRLMRVEALVRWEEPDLGAVSPALFVALAEEHGLIADLTGWVLRTALGQWTAWKAAGLDTCVAVNISALSLEKLDFPDFVEEMCRELDVPADCLVLELTEGATQPLINLMDTLTRFRIKGIALALDDFGTGYSSLLQLRHLPFTEVKIDRAFVSDVVTSTDCRLIVQFMIELARALGLVTIGEGIETPAQLRLLRELGCEIGQGYLISKALDPGDLAQWTAEFAESWPNLIAAPDLRPS